MFLIKCEAENKFACKITEGITTLVPLNGNKSWNEYPTRFNSIQEAQKEIDHHLLKDKTWSITSWAGTSISLNQ